MICNTIGLTADSFESIYTTGGTEVEEVYGAINYAQPIYAKTREMTGNTPLSFTSRVAGTLTDYRIYGETIQDGTPSPDMPVDVVGCGVRTENLWDPLLSETERIFKIKPYTAYVASKYDPLGALAGRLDITIYDANMNLLWTNYAKLWTGVACPAIFNAKYAKVSIAANVQNPERYVSFMEGTGDYRHLYIPHGYKLPVTTTNGTDTVTTPVYIGAEPLHRIGEYADYVDYASGKIVRKIKKFVFDGTEGLWTIWDNVTAYRGQSPSGYLPNGKAFCTHFVDGLRNSDGKFGFDNYINFRDGYHTITSNAFNEYLAAQYAAGTPVTVWYVLATPIEEDPPVLFPELPTLSGTNSMSVDTTVKPSQIYIKGKIKPDGYGKLVDKNGVYILDKDGAQLTVHGQGTSN